MSRVSRDASAAERARWLAELSEVLDEAHKLASELGLAHIDGAEAMELRMRLAAARTQVRALQLGRPEDRSDEADPKWSNPPVWPSDRSRNG